MKRYLLFSAAAVLLVAGLWYADTHLAALPPPAPAAIPLPTQTPEPDPLLDAGTGPQVVVLSLDGAQGARVKGFLADGTMPQLARLREQGVMAQYVLSVDPPLTAPGHVSLATGAFPAVTGVVADRLHRPEDDLSTATDALSHFPLQTELVWRTAMREGRRAAVLFWPGIDLDDPASLADYTVTQGAVDAESAQHEVALAPASAWMGQPSSFSPALEGTFTIDKDGAPLAEVYVLAIDTTEDHQVNYDAFYLDRKRQVTGDSARLHPGETAPLLVDELLASGAYFTLTRVDPERVTIFQSRLCYNQARPDDLLREINARLGFFPAPADDGALQRGWITPEQYLHMAQIQSSWMMSVTTFVLETYQPELLFTWQGAAEQVQRTFLLTGGRQPNYTPEKAAEYEQYVRRGYALDDAALGDLMQALDLQKATLLVVADHGMAPVHTQVNLNTILSARNLLVCQGPDNEVSLAQSRALAYASGSAAHIYINLRGRERSGIVSTEEYQAVQDEIVAALQETQDENGQSPFSQVLRREELGGLNLEAPAAGDVFVQAAPGYALSDRRGEPAVLGPAEHYAEAGLPSGRPEMQGIFLATGHRIRREPEVDPVHILDLAPTVDYLLGLELPPSLAGRVLEEVFLP